MTRRPILEPLLPDHGLSRGREIWQEWLGLTKELKFPGTTFCTTRLAQSAPELLRETAARGHEIASHGWSHRLGDDLQLLSSRTLLQEISGQGVDGFRSPRLRKINKEEITQAGFRYDASLNPTWIPGRYDHRREPRRPFQIGSLWEVPAAVLPGIRFPCFGPVSIFCLCPSTWLCVRKFSSTMGSFVSISTPGNFLPCPSLKCLVG